MIVRYAFDWARAGGAIERSTAATRTRPAARTRGRRAGERASPPTRTLPKPATSPSQLNADRGGGATTYATLHPRNHDNKCLGGLPRPDRPTQPIRVQAVLDEDPAGDALFVHGEGDE